LKQAGVKGWIQWALPYWDYTRKGEDRAPDHFLSRQLSSGSLTPLYESSRRVMINDGNGISKMLQPKSALGWNVDDLKTKEKLWTFTTKDAINDRVPLWNYPDLDLAK
tara:strand:+ start:211 stop:534 length:324 start_codon:yes stop_codon:yes gene_type:complete